MGCVMLIIWDPLPHNYRPTLPAFDTVADLMRTQPECEWQLSSVAANFFFFAQLHWQSWWWKLSWTVRRHFTLRFLCSWRSGWGAGLGPGFDGRPVVTWSGGGTFLYQPRRTREVHWSTLVLQGGGREVWSRRDTKKDNKRGPINIMRLIWTRTQCDPARVMQRTVITLKWVTLSSVCVSGCHPRMEQKGDWEAGRGGLCSIYPDTRPEAGKLQRLQIGFCHAPRATRIRFNARSNWTLTVNKSVDLSRLLLKLKLVEFIEKERQNIQSCGRPICFFLVAEADI